MSRDTRGHRHRSRRLSCVALGTLLVFVALTLTSCSSPDSADELVGEYLAKYPDGHETLTLAADGTFRQEINIEGMDTLVNEGRWSYDGEFGYLTLEDYVEAYDFWDKRNPDLENAPTIRVHTRVTKLPFGRISFMQSESNSYEKQD